LEDTLKEMPDTLGLARAAGYSLSRLLARRTRRSAGYQEEIKAVG